MSAVLPTVTIRQRVAEVIAAISAVHVESQFGYDNFSTIEPGSLVHLSFAVGVPGFVPVAIETNRQRRRAMGFKTHSDIGVRFAFRVVGGEVVTGYDAALEAQAAIIQAVAGASRIEGFGITFVRALNTVTPGNEAFIGDLTFLAHHRYPTI